MLLYDKPGWFFFVDFETKLWIIHVGLSAFKPPFLIVFVYNMHYAELS